MGDLYPNHNNISVKKFCKMSSEWVDSVKKIILFKVNEFCWIDFCAGIDFVIY